MRIHTSLTLLDIEAAARRAGVQLERCTQHRSRKAARAFDVILSGSASTRWRNSGTHGASDYKAATWDEWGIFLDVLFRRDPNTWCYAYSCQDHFQWSTGNRYDTLTAEAQHIRHKWQHDSGPWSRDYAVRNCDCGAVCRWMTRGQWTSAARDETADLYRESDEEYHGPYESHGRYARELIATD